VLCIREIRERLFAIRELRPGLDIILPSTWTLSAEWSCPVFKRERIPQEIPDAALPGYNYVLTDCPPVGLLTFNADGCN